MSQKRKLIYLSIVLVALTMGIAAGIYLKRPQVEQADIGDSPRLEKITRLIDFTLPDLQGRPRQISEWKGKWILLNFWATWCPPCREEIPLLVETQERYGSKGLQIIGIAIDEPNDVRDFVDTYFINYPNLIGDDLVMQLMAQYGNRIGTLPFSVVVDPKGHIKSRKMGAYTKETLEKALIQPLLSWNQR